MGCVGSAICVKRCKYCKLTAKLCVFSDGECVTVRVHSNELNKIVDGKKVTPAESLYAALFNIKYEFHVVVGIL